MRRLGCFLVLAACGTQPSGSDSDHDSTTSSVVGSSSEDDGGVHTVTGWMPSSGDEETSSDPDETGAVSTSTTDDPGDDSTGDDTETGNAKQCGNGVVEGDEFCDDGNQENTDNCTVECKLPTCGDGLDGPDEVCDDGNEADNDACPANCKAAYCGDGYVWDSENSDEHEECDDANALETDACLPTCKAATCGDGKVWAGHEVCDDGFNINDYNGCKPGCASKSDMYCGDHKVQPVYEHCDGATGMSNVSCDACLYDFSQMTQMSCVGTCGYGASPGCGQDDADAFCKLLTGNASAKATSWKLSPPTDQGGFACSDHNVFLQNDTRKWLGAMTQFGINKDVAWQQTGLKSNHGMTNVLQAAEIVCDG